MKLYVNSARYSSKKSRVVAAEDDFEEIVVDDDDFSDTIDDVSDTVDDIKDSIDEIKEDDVNIEVENNIENHYIAECDTCNGVFISATVESDQEVEKVTGICPLCGKESEQYLKWVIRDAKADKGGKDEKIR